MKRCLLLPAILLVVSGCALLQQSKEIESANGRVLSAAEQEIPQGQPRRMPQALPQGGFAAPVPTPPAFPRTHLYELKLDDGRTIRTESPMNFNVGDCVMISIKDAPESPGGLVRSTLSKGSGCK